MTFREMLKKYKEGTLSAQETELLEREIEKHEAISDYLIEEEIPGLDEILDGRRLGAGSGTSARKRENAERPGGANAGEAAWSEAGDGETDGRGADASDKTGGGKEPCASGGTGRRAASTAVEKDGGGKRPGISDGVGRRVATDADEFQFVSLVNRSIRRAFRRLAVGVLAITLAVVLFLQFCLPHLVSAFYYNPAKDVGADQNQMSLDLAVYSELFWPGQQRQQVNVEAKGYGEYDISIPQTVSWNHDFTTVTGEITRGKLKLYDTNVLKAPTGNCFAWCQAIGDLSKPLTEIWEDGAPETSAETETAGSEQEKTEEDGALETAAETEILGSGQKKNEEDGAPETAAETETAGDDESDSWESYNTCAAGPRSFARETLEALSDTEMYIGFVSLNEMMRYEPFVEFVERQENVGNVWCAVKTNEPERFYGEDGAETEQIFRADNIGFVCSPSSSTSFVWDEEKYPELMVWNEVFTEDEVFTGDETFTEEECAEKDDQMWQNWKSEAYMSEHFISLLTYMADQKQFLTMMGSNEELRRELREDAEYIRENGITVYGFAAIMNKETMLRLEALDEVYEIYVENLR